MDDQERTEEGQEQEGGLGPACAFSVYFPGTPTIDEAALLEWLNSCDPDDEERWEIVASLPASESDEHPSLMGARRAIAIGGFNFMLLDHGVPAPEGDAFDMPTIPPEVSESLKTHQGFTLVMAFGGSEYAPLERALVMTKLALALIHQGALGYYIPDLETAFGRDMLLEYEAEILEDARNAPAPGPDDDPDDAPAKNIWDLLRTAIEPRRLIFTMVVVQGEDSRTWAATRGMALYGLPEVAARIDRQLSQERAVNLVELVAKYQLTAGNVLDVGHTMGLDERVAVRIAAPTEEEEEGLGGSAGLLIATLGEEVKKSSLFGRLFDR